MVETNLKKKDDVSFLDIVDGAGKAAEKIYELRKDDIEGLKEIDVAFIQQSIETAFSEIATLYTAFRRLGFTKIQSTIRTRQGILQMCDNNLNLRPIDIERLMKPYETVKHDTTLIDRENNEAMLPAEHEHEGQAVS